MSSRAAAVVRRHAAPGEMRLYADTTLRRCYFTHGERELVAPGLANRVRARVRVRVRDRVRVGVRVRVRAGVRVTVELRVRVMVRVRVRDPNPSRSPSV